MFIQPALNATEALLSSDILWMRNEPEGYKWYSVLSHLAYLVPTIVAALYRLPIVAFLSFTAGAISVGYHTCIEFARCMAVLPYTWRLSDRMTANAGFMAAFSVFMETRMSDVRPTRQDYAEILGEQTRRDVGPRALNTDTLEVLDPDEGNVGARFDPALYQKLFANFWIAFALVVLFLSVLIYGLDENVTYFVIISCVIAYMLHDALFYVEPTTPATSRSFILYPRSVSYPWIIMGFACGAIAIFFFILPSHEHSSFAHSTWHVFSALAITFFVLGTQRRPIVESMYEVEADSDSDSEIDVSDDPSDEEEEEEKAEDDAGQDT